MMVRKWMINLVVSSLLFVFIVGCGQHPHQDPQNNSATYSNQDIDKQVIKANSQFGFKLYQEILKQNHAKNVFVSPSSIALALAMTYNGASGETQKAMAEALQIQGLDLEEFNQANAALKYVLENADPTVQLTIANSLWASERNSFKQEFIHNNTKHYKAEMTKLDFNSSSAAQMINSWVKKNTNGKIEKIVEDPIDPDTVLFLINAIYFNGQWTNEFNEKSTREADFHLLTEKTKKHPFMVQSGEYNYFENMDG